MNKICVICGTIFTTNYTQTKTCSSSCGLLLKKRNNTLWRKYNKTSFNAYKREYYKTKDKVRISAKQKVWRQSTIGKNSKKEQQKKRLLRDPLFKLKRNLRKRLWEYKQRLGTISMSKSIGCSWDHFKQHIEKQFYSRRSNQEVMTWDNYGVNGWEIDHIIPLCKAISIKDLERLSHYTNLQPLWREDNNIKALSDAKLKF